jgi:ComF family protein
MTSLLPWATKIANLFYPNICQACAKELVGNENSICVACWKDLPETKFHLQINNPLEQKFWGRIPIEYATSMYYFNKDARIQDILHALKYRKNTDIGLMLGRKFAEEIKMCTWIADIDCLIPIPLSKKKTQLRGYNQSEYIAKGMGEVLNLEVITTAVERIKHTETQTSKTRAERLDNMKAAFEVKEPSMLNQKHVLLIDDVITTGATLESCAEAILKQGNTKLSIATLAYAID